MTFVFIYIWHIVLEGLVKEYNVEKIVLFKGEKIVLLKGVKICLW
jgi:hypothetical protein